MNSILWQTHTAMLASFHFLGRINELPGSKGCQACQLPSGFVTYRHANRKKDFENDGEFQQFESAETANSLTGPVCLLKV